MAEPTLVAALSALHWTSKKKKLGCAGSKGKARKRKEKRRRRGKKKKKKAKLLCD